jgi:L-rhamnose isomerase
VEIIKIPEGGLPAGLAVDLTHQCGGIDIQCIFDDSRVKKWLAGFHLVAHRAAINTLEAYSVHQVEAFIPHGPAIGIALKESHFERRVAAE